MEFCSTCGAKAHWRCPRCGAFSCVFHEWARAVDDHKHSQTFDQCTPCHAPIIRAWLARRPKDVVACSIELKQTPMIESDDRELVRKLFVALGQRAMSSGHPPTTYSEKRFLRTREFTAWSLVVDQDCALLRSDGYWVPRPPKKGQPTPLVDGPASTFINPWETYSELKIHGLDPVV